MSNDYIVKSTDNTLFYDEAIDLKLDSLRLIGHPIRLKILRLLAKKPMYPIELAKALKMHEQKVYYHVRQLQAAEAIEVVEKKEIRGTTAKRFSPRALNFTFSLSFRGRNLTDLIEKSRDTVMDKFLHPFINKGRYDSHIVVGSPDPHGPFKARARDGHYAVELALFLGGLSSLSHSFSTKLDVDTDLKKDKNLIIVGGPVTNLTMAKVNDLCPAKFSDKKPWGIVGKENYADDSIGLISKVKNPHFAGGSLLIIAGIRFAGTKAAILGLTRFHKLILSRYNEQKEFYAIVQGFDLDGDGQVDSVELLE